MSIYPVWLRIGVTFLVPIAFAITVPAEAVTSRLGWETVADRDRLLGGALRRDALVVGLRAAPLLGGVRLERSGAQPPVRRALTPRYHVPSSQTWAGSGGRAQGNVHLHVLKDMTLGRRVRKQGECLCSKKHGTYEREPEGETNLARSASRWPSRTS